MTNWFVKQIWSIWKVSCQEAATSTLWTLACLYSTGQKGLACGSVHILQASDGLKLCLVLPRGSPNWLGWWSVLTGRQRFSYTGLLIFHWGWGLGGRHEIIYMYGPRTAISFHSWYFPIPLRSSHYTVAFAGILVVSQKKSSAAFLNLCSAISGSLSGRFGLGSSALEPDINTFKRKNQVWGMYLTSWQSHFAEGGAFLHDEVDKAGEEGRGADEKGPCIFWYHQTCEGGDLSGM